MPDWDEARDWIVSAARRLTARRSLPVPILDICAEFGVEIRVGPSALAPRKRGALIQSKTATSIVVYRDEVDSVLSRKEAFTIAHELGHLILIRRHGWEPSGRREYYKIEALCDLFAAHLLVPEKVVCEIGVSSAKRAVTATRSVAAACYVSAETAGRRIVEVVPRIAIITVVKTKNKAKRDVWQVLWGASSIPSLPFNARSHLHTNTGLGKYLESCRGMWQGTNMDSDSVVAGKLSGYVRPVQQFGKGECLLVGFHEGE